MDRIAGANGNKNILASKLADIHGYTSTSYVVRQIYIHTTYILIAQHNKVRPANASLYIYNLRNLYSILL